jgi:hypothetical protein
MKTAIVLLLAFSASLVACSKSEPPPPVATAQPAPLPNSNVFSADIKALEKAKKVQDIADQGKQNTDKQLQDAEGGH